jgi:hypothetical protein
MRGAACPHWGPAGLKGRTAYVLSWERQGVMLRVGQERLDEMEKQYPGIIRTILYFENAKLPACFGCGSEDTADVQRGLIGRTVNIATATTKFKLIPGGPAPKYFCNTCGRFFYWPGEGHGVFDTEEVLRRIALREERGHSMKRRCFLQRRRRYETKGPDVSENAT